MIVVLYVLWSLISLPAYSFPRCIEKHDRVQANVLNWFSSSLVLVRSLEHTMGATLGPLWLPFSTNLQEPLYLVRFFECHLARTFDLLHLLRASLQENTQSATSLECPVCKDLISHTFFVQWYLASMPSCTMSSSMILQEPYYLHISGCGMSPRTRLVAMFQHSDFQKKFGDVDWDPCSNNLMFGDVDVTLWVMDGPYVFRIQRIAQGARFEMV